MNKFDAKFRDQLKNAVQEIEKISGVELVVTILPRVRKYWEINLALGSILAGLVFSLLMFLPIEFHYVLIYFETIAAFGIGFSLPILFPGITRFWVGEKGRKESATRASRAIFQEAHIYETSRRAGVLMVFCWQERELVILADRGAEEWVPPAEWETLKKGLTEVFFKKDPPSALIKMLVQTRAIFQKYIPRHADDVNELPDELWIQS